MFGFESFVGLRYLMAKRQRNVLSVITLISIGGVSVGVMALIVVLSVMGGFESDLRQKILGTKSHIVISAADGNLRDYAPLLARASAVAGVVGASPYVEGEVMVNSASNLQGVLMRGVLVDHVVTVSKLASDLTQGSLDYLDHPDRLLAELKKTSAALLKKTPAEEQAHARAMIQLMADDHGGFIRDALAAPPPLPTQPGQPAPNLPAPNLPAPGQPAPDAPPPTQTAPQPLPTWPPDTLPPRPASATLGPAAAPQNPAPTPTPAPKPDPLTPPTPATDPTPAVAADPAPAPGGPKRRTMKPIPTAPAATAAGEPGQRRVPGLILGQELKKNLDASLGDEVNIMSPMADMGPSGRMPKSRPFRVVGTFFTGMYEFDTKLVYVPLEDAQRFLNMPGQISGIEVKVADPEQSEAVRDALQAALADWPQPLKVKDWRELNASLFSALLLEKVAMFIILTFIILVASFSIVCLLIMIVIEKGREISVLKSMGATNGSIMQVFVLQGLVIGVVGTALGLSAGLLLCDRIKAWRLQFPSDVYYLTQIPVETRPWEVAFICLSAIGISLLATVYPSIQAARLNPVDGLRFD